MGQASSLPVDLAGTALNVTVFGMNSGKSAPLETKDIVRRFIAGDRQASEDLYRLHAPRVLSFLAARTKSLHDAEDLLHTAWLKAQQNAGSFDGQDFRAWFFQIARNTLFDFSKSRRNRSKTARIDDVSERGGEFDPSERMSRGEELLALKECLKSLGGVFIEALVRTQLQGDSPEVLADQINVKRGTIDTRVSRGKQQLRECLEKKLK